MGRFSQTNRYSGMNIVTFMFNKNKKKLNVGQKSGKTAQKFTLIFNPSVQFFPEFSNMVYSFKGQQ